MGKLSTIEGLEKRAREQVSQQAGEQFHARQAQTGSMRTEEATKAQMGLADDANMTAQQEEAFHGLDEQKPMSLGHKSLIILATAVLVVAILYIVNSWIHFV